MRECFISRKLIIYGFMELSGSMEQLNPLAFLLIFFFTSKITAMAGLFEHPLGEFELVSLGDLWTYLLLSFVLVFSVIRLMQF